MQVSVIIPIYNALPLAKDCLASIFAAPSALEFEVIAVDNGSAPDVEHWLLAEERLHANLRHLRYPEPLGYARAVNVGADASVGDVLILLNSDTVVSAGWMEGLARALFADPTLGAVTPSTNWSGEPAQIEARATGLSASKALAAIAAAPSPETMQYLPDRVVFFCAAVRRTVWLELGGIAECYPVGNFEDYDFCLRLRLAGYRLGVARHVFVYHHNGGTFRDNRIRHDERMVANAEIFAGRARSFATAPLTGEPRWPKLNLPDISVVIHPRANAPLERTLQSLRNQTVTGFEVVTPESGAAPTRTWIAHIPQGAIFYPFHLEMLYGVLERFSADAAFSDAWNAGSAAASLGGWMHHRSLDPDRLREQASPVHWERVTWDAMEAAARQPQLARRSILPEFLGDRVVEPARQFYRRKLSLETRHAIDARVRKLLFLPPWVPPEEQIPLRRQGQLREQARQLTTLLTRRVDAGLFQVDTALPAVFLFNTVSWNSIVQRPHHFARGLARRGHPVFWIEIGLNPPQRWWSGRPLPQPVAGVHLVRLPGIAREIHQMAWDQTALETTSLAVAQLASAYGVREAVSLVQLPKWAPLAFHLRERHGWKVVYDCLDNQSAFAELFHNSPSDHEDRLIGQSDILITSSAVLRKRMLPRRPSLLLHNAADCELFSRRSGSALPFTLPRPVAGFFGAIADWLDIGLIRAAALRFPAWSFIYIGPHCFSGPGVAARWMEATNLPNITRLPQMEPDQLATYLEGFDVCIVPFQDMPITRTMNAVKIYEYLAAGKPVVSRDLPEIRCIAEEPGASGLVALYSTPEEFFDQLQEAVESNNPELAQRRQDFARCNDWSVRIEALAREILRA